MFGFSKKKYDRLSERWPKNENGENVEPVFFRHVAGSDLDVEIEVNLLEAYGIPVLKKPCGSGDLGVVILGYSGEGFDLYVPATMKEDAENITSGEIVEDEE